MTKVGGALEGPSVTVVAGVIAVAVALVGQLELEPGLELEPWPCTIAD